MTKAPSREHWKSQLGFIWSAIGSAIGLGSIWRFPYVVGENGGAAFICVYLICLFVIGFPILISEIIMGRRAQLNPVGTFSALGENKRYWKYSGYLTVLTGLLVSAFYAVISGWAFGYFVQAIMGKLMQLTTSSDAIAYFEYFQTSPWWSVGALVGFLCIACTVLYTGVQKGIERGNTIMIPLLMIVLLVLAIKGLMSDGAFQSVLFLFKPDFALLTPAMILIAMGHAFFSLSLGQGTMITYGSYLGDSENIPRISLPIVLSGVAVSLLAGLAIFPMVFSASLSLSSGERLMFQILPMIFSTMYGGYVISVLFFFLLVLAALTSQISAMEPMIAYLRDRWQLTRRLAVCITTLCVLVLAIPCSLSFGPWRVGVIFGHTLFHWVLTICLHVLIPLGGLASVLLVGWKWTFSKAFIELSKGSGDLFTRHSYLKWYFYWCIRYLCPLIILLIMIDVLIFS